MSVPDPQNAKENAAKSWEVVAQFDDRHNFDRTIAYLLAQGFDRTDLSVLSTHEALDVAQAQDRKSWRDRIVALSGEMQYEGPLVNASLIAMASGPVGAILSGLIAAGLGGVAFRELMDEVSAFPSQSSFDDALAVGQAILWVRVSSPRKEEIARNIISENHGKNVHVFPEKEV